MRSARKAIAMTLIGALVALSVLAVLAVWFAFAARAPGSQAGVREVAAGAVAIVAAAALWHVFDLVRRHFRDLERARGAIVTLTGNRSTVLPFREEGEASLEMQRLYRALASPSLREGVEDTATLKRIAALHEAGVLSDNDADYLRGAFTHITFLLLRQQLSDFRAGEKVGNHVHPDKLTEREKDMLVDSLKAIDDLRQRVHGEFTGDVF